jgi:hypothetical protein
LKKLLPFFLFFFFFDVNAWEWSDLAGKPFDTLNIGLGSFVFHINNPRHDYKNFYPTFDASYKGFAAMYFKNTHDDHTYGVGVERYWKDWEIFSGHSYIGYRGGVIYGYCRTSWSFSGLYSRCKPRTGEPFPVGHEPKQGLQPIGQLFWTYRRHGVGVYFATAIALSTLSLVFYFE